MTCEACCGCTASVTSCTVCGVITFRTDTDEALRERVARRGPPPYHVCADVSCRECVTCPDPIRFPEAP